MSTNVTLSKPVPFSKPIVYGDGTLSELTFRRPVAGDLRGLKLGGLADMDVDLVLAIASRTSVQHVVPEQLQTMDPADFLKVATEIVGFFTDAPSPTTPTAPGLS